ncbi:MAG: hypothetical protein VX460_10255, partial [Planctomycetota bacterium]|nr:hypothetical protein [Planctomycetota bacterium]
QLYGDPLFDAASVQYLPQSVEGMTHLVRQDSREASRKWIIDMDENGMWDVGLSGSNAGEMRQQVLYDVLFSNGGVEWYCGYHSLPLGGDVRMEDFRTREEMWRYSRIAREFLEEHFDLERAVPGDHLVQMGPAEFGGAETFLQHHRRMAIYLSHASTAPTVDLRHHDGVYSVQWISPRTGQVAAHGPDVTQTDGTLTVLQVVAPEPQQDWIVLLERIDG